MPEPSVPTPAAKIIPFAARPPAGSLARLRRLAVDATTKGWRASAQALDDHLFHQSENRASDAVFDHLRDWRKDMEGWIQRGVQQTERLWSAWGAADPIVTPRQKSSGDLSLVDEQELEEVIALDVWSQRVEQEAGLSLVALRERLATMTGSGQQREDGASMPCDPSVWATVLRTATATTSLPIRARLVLYKLAETHLRDSVLEFYDAANAMLIAERVLPNLNPAARARPVHTTEAQPGTVAGGPPGATIPAAMPTEAWMQMVQALLRRSHDPPDAVPVSAQDLRRALDRLEALTPDGTVPPAELQDRLRATLSSDHGPRAGLGEHEAAIELTASVFGFVLKDKAMPATVQALLARLQLPFLRMAVEDRTLFAREDHPARRFLDALAEAGRHVTDDDHPQALLDAVRACVETAAAPPPLDAPACTKAREHIQGVLRAHQQRAATTERRAAAATAGQERMAQARATVVGDLTRVLTGSVVPDWLRALFWRPWANSMVFVCLREGADSAAYRRALRFVDQVLLFHRPSARAMAQKLDPVREWLLQQAREGLAATGIVLGDQDRLVRRLDEHLRECLGERPAPPPPLVQPVPESAASAAGAVLHPGVETSAPTPADAAVADIVEAVPLVPSVPPSPAAPTLADPADAAYAAAVDSLRPGEWVEIARPEGGHVRAKLSWVSTITHRFLFVNGAGQRQMEMARADLVRAFAEHRVYALDARPLTQRALQQAARDLVHGEPALSAGVAPVGGTP